MTSKRAASDLELEAGSSKSNAADAMNDRANDDTIRHNQSP